MTRRDKRPSKRLALMRHAKSSWADPDIDDHDRPLNTRGRRAAKLVGRHLRDGGLRPDLVLCSSATRARETVELLHLPAATDVLVEDQLYGATARVLLARLQRVPAAVGCVLLVAHNPGVEELAWTIVADRAGLPEQFPTAAVADLRLPIRSWTELEPRTGRLHGVLIPRKLSEP